MNAKANTERQREHYEKMKAAGMKKVSVYVPADQVGRLRKYAARLRKAVS
jgi:hypothetical protein